MRAFTLSSIRASASACGALNWKPKGEGRGLSVERVSSAASSAISTRPRFSSVRKVVRGTSRVRRLSTAILPPAAASASTSVRWLGLSLPSALFSTATLKVRAASRTPDKSSRRIHFLRTMPSRTGFETRVADRKAGSRIISASARWSSTRNSANCSSGVLRERAEEPAMPARCNAICPSGVMR